jgi:lauroyl/myristoyl acyltransferase
MSRTDRLRRAALRAAHRTADASFAPGSVMARREASALLGAAIGLAGAASRDEIRRVARRSSRPVVFYDALWSVPAAWRSFVVAGRAHLDAALARGRGVLVVPSHFGPYRWTAPALLELGLRVTLLVDERNQDLVDADVARRMDRLFPALAWDHFATVSSADPAALWQLARALRAARAVLMFADGNSGIDGLAAARGALTLPFLGQEIRVRPGIGALAANTDAAVLPVFAQDRGLDPPILRFDPPILRAAAEPRPGFAARVMRSLFATLEREVLAQPTRWEEWWLLPRWLASAPRLPPPRVRPPPRIPVTLPALVGQRLCLARDDIWQLWLGERPAVCVLGTGAVLPVEPALGDLLVAAEQGSPAIAWARAQPDPAAARHTLRAAFDAGLVSLRRDRPE